MFLLLLCVCLISSLVMRYVFFSFCSSSSLFDLVVLFFLPNHSILSLLSDSLFLISFSVSLSYVCQCFIGCIGSVHKSRPFSCVWPITNCRYISTIQVSLLFGSSAFPLCSFSFSEFLFGFRSFCRSLLCLFSLSCSFSFSCIFLFH